jgi:hypothetical protein
VEYSAFSKMNIKVLIFELRGRTDRTQPYLTDQTNFRWRPAWSSRGRLQSGSRVDQHMTNAEGLVGLEFHTFRFRTTDISSTLKVFPSFSVPGRVRIDLDSGCGSSWSGLLLESQSLPRTSTASLNQREEE